MSESGFTRERMDDMFAAIDRGDGNAFAHFLSEDASFRFGSAPPVVGRAEIEAGAAGGAYAVSEINLKYLRPAKLDDDVVIETTCTDLGAASCRMHQLAKRGEEVLCEANLRVGFITLEGRPRRQPAQWRAAFHDFMTREED